MASHYNSESPNIEGWRIECFPGNRDRRWLVSRHGSSFACNEIGAFSLGVRLKGGEVYATVFRGPDFISISARASPSLELISQKALLDFILQDCLEARFRARKICRMRLPHAATMANFMLTGQSGPLPQLRSTHRPAVVHRGTR
jgi:hypothetical protein